MTTHLDRAMASPHAPSAPDPLAVERISDPAAFRALQEDWAELLADSASNGPFLTWEWLHTWWTHLAGRRELFVLTVRSSGRLVAIAPLTRRRRWAAGVVPVGVLEMLGSDRLCSDYLDVILRRGWEAAAIDALTGYLAQDPVRLEIANIDRTCAVAPALARALGDRGWRLTERDVDICPFIDLAGQTWESYLGTLDAKERSDFGRRLRNLNKQFSVGFEEARSQAQRREFFSIFVALHNRRRRERGGSDAFHTADLVAFHDELTRLMCERGWLRMFLLSLDGRPVAALYGFRHDRTFYFLNTGFDPEYARHAVGLITVGLTIQSAIAEGVDAYDFLRGAEPYKFRWAREVRRLTTLTICPDRARERLHRRAQAVSVAARRTARRALPKPVLDRIAVYRQSGLRGWLAASR